MDINELIRSSLTLRGKVNLLIDQCIKIVPLNKDGLKDYSVVFEFYHYDKAKSN